MRKDVTVFFACNDPNTGEFAGQAVQVNVSMGFDDMDLELDCGGGVAFTQLDGAFRIHRHIFKTKSVSYWTGNWCWNGYRMPYGEYRRLVRLLARHGWKCTGCTQARWGDAYESIAGRLQESRAA